ncbi:MAG: hypothetical protein ACMG6S_02965 [Byssovorax sp.]
MDTAEDRLDLLLVDAEERRPVIEGGLPSEAAQRGPKPKKGIRGDDSPDWRRTDADPNDLALQKWAVVAMEGKEGDRQIEAIQPLIRLREREQGAPARVYRVPPDMDARQAVSWKDEVYWSEDVPEEERPLYLLMLGDLHHTSVELQHALANGALVGRLHVADAAGGTDLEGYEAYAAKVVRYARDAVPVPAPDLRFYVAPDGSSATVTGRTRLVGPSLVASRQAHEGGKLPAASVDEISAETVDELLANAQSRASVLLSVSHGLGAPRRGWRSEEEQWRRQGALVLGHDEILDAERLRGQAFLPGGMWFYLACFGGGTPTTSAYHTWLAQLSSESAFSGSVAAVLKSLPESGQRPFLAALPQAALSNPEGPLGVLAHMDLAWTYGFSGAKKLTESRKSRVLSSLDVLVRGSRAGVALEALVRFYRETNDALMASYQLEADARAQGRPDPTSHAERAHLWMLRNDLRGYVLLGDPAARLPLQHTTLRAGEPPPAREEVTSASTTAASIPDGGLEAAVLAMIRGDEAPRAIAERAGITLATLWDRVDAYRAAGRARLGG